MLKALWRWLWPNEAGGTRARHDDPVVTIALLENLLEEHMKELVFEWNEMYEKFSQLHLRLSKRESRSKKDLPQLPLRGDVEPNGERVSAFHYRRPGSV